MCNWSPDWIVWQNYEVVELLTHSMSTAFLDYITYCYVSFTPPLLHLSSRPPDPSLCSLPHHSLLLCILLRPQSRPYLHPHGVLCPPGHHLYTSQNHHPTHGFIRPPGRHPYLSQNLGITDRLPPLPPPPDPTAWYSNPVPSSWLPVRIALIFIETIFLSQALGGGP